MLALKRLGLVVVILAIAYVLWRMLSPSAGDKAPQQASQRAGVPGAKPPAVEAIVLQPQLYNETVTLTGTVTADQSVELRAEVAGRIIKIGFVEGRDVTAGQLLVKLSDAELVARRQKLRQQAVLDNSRKERLDKLRLVDGASLDEYETALAQVEMRAAEIAELDAQIAKTEVRAPFSGKIGLRLVSIGAVITPSTMLASLTSTGTQNVDCSVPERFAMTLRDGATIRFRVRGADTSMRTAHVVAIEPLVDVRTRTQRVRARIEAPHGLSAGMFADVYLSLKESRDALLVPTESVVQDLQGASVFRMENGLARSVPVNLGSRTAKLVHVVTGLRQGDTIVTSGILFVKNGLPARVTVR